MRAKTHKTTQSPTNARVAFRQFKLYCKLVVFGAVVVIIAATLFYNRDNDAEVWFFKSYEKVNVIKLMLGTALGAILGFWMLTHSFKLYKEWKQVAQTKAGQQREQDLVRREQELSAKERQLQEQAQATGEEPTEKEQDA